jgi:hypothetical protein
VSFCFLCHNANRDGTERKLQKGGHDAFIEGGLSNCKKALDRFKAHESSSFNSQVYKIEAQSQETATEPDSVLLL